jgi:hypothetical protein
MMARLKAENLENAGWSATKEHINEKEARTTRSRVESKATTTEEPKESLKRRYEDTETSIERVEGSTLHQRLDDGDNGGDDNERNWIEVPHWNCTKIVRR